MKAQIIQSRIGELYLEDVVIEIDNADYLCGIMEGYEFKSEREQYLNVEELRKLKNSLGRYLENEYGFSGGLESLERETQRIIRETHIKLVTFFELYAREDEQYILRFVGIFGGGLLHKVDGVELEDEYLGELDFSYDEDEDLSLDK